MRSVKVTYSNGDVIETDINGTNAAILAYFRIGRQFNMGDGRGGDAMAKVVKAEITR